MRIYLRALEADDYLITHQWRQDSEIANMLGGNRYYISKEREKKWAESKSSDNCTEIYLAICMLESEEMIGYCSITHIDMRNLKAELGGTIIGNREFWGKGLGKEAQILMLRHCFEEYPLHKVYGYSLEEHEVTKKMMLSLGFKIDGVLRDDIFKNGEYKSLYAYSIIRNEYVSIYGIPSVQ